MNFGELFVFTIIVFFPGIMCAVADRTWGHDKSPPLHMLFVKSLGFGLFIYLILEFSFNLIGWVFEIPITFENPVWKLNDKFVLDGMSNEILTGMLAALVFIIVWSYNVKYDFFTKSLHKIGAVERIQRAKMSSLLLSHHEDIKLIVRVSDFKNDRSYVGGFVSLEENDNVIGVLLKNVTICNIGGNVIRETEQIICSILKSNFTIEIISQEAIK